MFHLHLVQNVKHDRPTLFYKFFKVIKLQQLKVIFKFTEKQPLLTHPLSGTCDIMI